MIKKWIALAAVWGAVCLAAPTAVLAAAQTDQGGAVLQEDKDTDGEETEDKSYQATEAGTNAQGQRVVLDTLWEYDQGNKTYRLVKSRDAQGTPTYYTQGDGVLQLGRTPGYYYAFDAKGDMVTTARSINGMWYSFTPRAKAAKTQAAVAPDGTTVGMAMKNCWVKVDKSWYHLNSVGQRAVGKIGLQKIEGSYYYLDKAAVPYTDRWIKKSNGAWWYFGKTGKYNSAKVGVQKIQGHQYHLKKNGIPYKKCFKRSNGKRYYYGKTGKRTAYTGWRTINKKKYYFSSKHYVVVKSGWQTIRKKQYYFGPKGGMYAKTWATIAGKRYYFRANGQMATGWAKADGTYHYFTSAGTLDRSTIAKWGKDYYLVTPQGTRGANILDGVGVTAAMDSGAKLQTCFNYVVRNCRYAGGVVWPPQGWEPYHAYKMLTMRFGNCYDFAAAFCYLAKAVGYEGMICIRGQCASASGGLTPHSWCELNGRVFDPEISYANGYHLFNVSYGSLPFAYVR